MSETDKNIPTPLTVATPQGPALVKLVTDVPVIFADGVSQHSTGPGTARFYLYRTEVNPQNANQSTVTPVIQIVMPAVGFADMLAFFELRAKVAVHRGDLDQKVLDARREHYSKFPVE
jgi:hypothetical protein